MATASHSRDGVSGEMSGSEISKEVIEKQFAIILSRDYVHMLSNATLYTPVHSINMHCGVLHINRLMYVFISI